MTAGGQHGAGVTAPGGHPRGNAAICPLAEGRPWPGPAPRSAGVRPPTLLGVEHEAHAGAPAPNRSSYFLPVVSELARSVCRRWICKQQVRTHQDVRIGTRTRPRIRPRTGTARRPPKRLPHTPDLHPGAGGAC